MATHRITSLAGWYQIDETGVDGSVTPIGNFRTEADAQEWLDTYLRMQNGRMKTGVEVFKVGYSVLPTAAPTSTEATASAEIEESVTAPGSR